MRILIVNRHIDDIAGGSEAQCHEIAAALAARGHEVVYAVCRPGRGGRELPYAVHPLRGRFRAALRRALRDVRPDVVYWRFNKRNLLGSVIDAHRAGAKFVFAVSHINDLRPIAAKPFHAAHLGAARRAARALGRARLATLGAVNHLALRLADGIVYQHAGQVPPQANLRHVVIHNSARPASGGEDEAGSSDDCRAPDPASAPFVLWAGNLKQSKNPEEFVRLAAELEHTGVEFRMAGEVQDPAYRSLVESDALPRSFRYLGHQPREALDLLTERCLLLAHTCDPEGFPNVFIQAWARGKPVASLHFDPGALLETHEIGLCADGDRALFKAHVERLILDDTLRSAMGRRARAFVSEHCDRDKNVARLEAFFEALRTAPAR